MSEEKRTEYLAVACYDEQGYPDFFRCKVVGTHAQRDAGDFYRAARTRAEELKFTAPMVVMDSDDPGFATMRMNGLDWSKVEVLTI